MRPAGALSRDVACVLGVPIDILDLRAVVERISSAVMMQKQLFISTPNLNFLALSHRSRQFRDSLWASDLCTADGVAVVGVCRLLGVRIPERVAGSDFLTALADEKMNGGAPISVLFFGGTEEAGRAACQTVNRDLSPRVRCLGHVSPGFGSAEEMSRDELLGEINGKAPDFLVVALGAEKGQAWIMRTRSRIAAAVVSHLGATINFLAGTVKRAPPAVRALNCEWLWRIYQEPRLARRYVSDAGLLGWLLVRNVVPFALWTRWSSFRFGKALQSEIVVNEAVKVLRIKGSARRDNIEQLRDACRRALEGAVRIRVELQELQWADANSMGVLLMLWKASIDEGIKVDFVNPSKNLRRGLWLNGLGDLVGETRSHPV